MLGIPNLEICPAKGEEKAPDGLGPAGTVVELARGKARSVALTEREEMEKGALIIAADTVVWSDGHILGKPHSEKEAAQMLRALSGKSHEVYTGVVLLDREGELAEAECSTVVFRKLSEEEIRRYIASGEPMDKAGAYGAQGKGALFVEKIDGDFFNVMGLPLCRLGQMLIRKGVSIL